MRKPTAYLSSSAAELNQFRREAFDLLDLYQFERSGMEHYKGQADSDIVKKCRRDAAVADFLVLIVAFRYGVPQPDFSGKSVVELEYEAAIESGRDVLAFCLDESERLESQFDDRIVLDDRGASIKRFRQRLIDEHHLVQFFTNLQTFSDSLGRTLSLRYAEFVRKQAEELSRRSTAYDPVNDALRESLKRLLREQEGFDQLYVPLAGMTTKPARNASWPSAFEDPTLTLGSDSVGDDELLPLANVVDALDQHNQFYLVGEPGGGKSLTLIALELESARRFVTNANLPFPLRIDVSSWLPGEQNFVDLIAEEMKSKTSVWPFPPERLLLLLDGAIDSAVARDDDPVEKISTWLRRHPRCSAILAVRLRAPRDGNLPVVRIHPLSDDRVHQFVTKRVGEEAGVALLDKIGWNRPSGTNGRDVRALIRNPFNLSLICKLQIANKPLTTQGDLIRQVVLTRLARESQRLGIPPITERFLDAFGAVAVAIIRNRGLLASDVGEVMKNVSDINELFDVLHLAFESKIVIERPSRKGFEFEHRLYLEYFAAERFRAASTLFAELLPPRFDLGQRVAQRFDEVVHTLVELDPSTKMIEMVTARDPFLAASCLSAFPQHTDERQNAEIAVAAGLVNMLRDRTSDAEARETAGSALAEIGLSAVEYLRRSLADPRHWVRRIAVRTLARIPHIDAVHTVVHALADENRWVRDDALFAIRHFDARLRDLFLQLISSPHWQSDGHERQIDERLASIFRDDPVLSEAIANATGIRVTKQEEVATAQTAPAEPEEPAPTSWGVGWLQEWHADPGNPELASRGLAWLHSAPQNDSAWAEVLVALWRRNPTDDVLEQIGRLWLNQASLDEPSWPNIWLLLLTRHPKDRSIVMKGARWLRDAAAAGLVHRGWPSVWSELWHRKENPKQLRNLGLSWLRSVSLSAHRWPLVWRPLWEAPQDKTFLDELGRRWIAHAQVEDFGWGVVWQALWSTSPGDRTLLEAGKSWIEHASIAHQSWGRIFPPVFAFLHEPKDLAAIGRQWLDRSPTNHLGWSYVWEALWKKDDRDPELRDLGHRWLSATPRLNDFWAKVWGNLWERSEGDPMLAAQALEWLRETSKRVHGWGSVLSSLLKVLPADPELLKMGYAFFEEASDSHRMWADVWRGLWDYGGDRALLASIGRRWVFTKGTKHPGFAFVWERLWMQNPEDEKLRNLGLRWLRLSPRDRKWAHGWEYLWRISPKDPELIDLAIRHLDEAGREAVDWAYTWRALADSGMEDPSFLGRGLDWLDEHPPDSESRGWAYVWTYFAARESSLLDRGWKWLEQSSFARNTWPEVWETLWQLDAAQRPRLAIAAVDWLTHHGPGKADRIRRWQEIASVPLDEPRRAKLETLLGSRVS